MGFFQVAKLVCDDIVDAVLRGLDQLQVQGDASIRRTASPTFPHPSDLQGRACNSLALSARQTEGEPLLENHLGTIQKPRLKPFSDQDGGWFLAGRDVKVTAQTLDAVLVTLQGT